jgi:putative RNA 2'-phosphotransferase
MAATIAHCDDHGYFDADRCPVCDDDGRDVLDGDRRRRLSKFVSGALRHFPTDAGLELDEAGWTPFEALVDAVEDQYGWADADALAGVVATDPKGRFERTGGGHESASDGRSGEPDDHVRAAYGHSVDVQIDAAETPVPDTLYHGTPARNVETIRREGLKPMSRQQVHLSETAETALDVGRRRGDDPALLVVDAAAMAADGHRITKRGLETYTTDRVPPQYVDER